VKAFRLLQQKFDLPEINIHLHKQIPFGAGLGGGSSNAAFMISGLNQLFDLNLELQELVQLAGVLGSDCPFFLYNRPIFAEGRGDVFSESLLRLKGYAFVLIKPDVSVSTVEAYANVVPKVPEVSLRQSINLPLREWKAQVVNRFEDSVFQYHPEIEKIKMSLYRMRALYASMSGSGSSVFGLFDELPDHLIAQFPNCFVWTEQCTV
jgi:4-diphosphocytidyl-2-C-methyl-D-erythritol kinase